MKKLFPVLLLLACFITAQAQGDSTRKYPRSNSLPDVTLLGLDSVAFSLRSVTDSGKKVVLLVFSPACDHCKKETEDLIAHMDQLKDIEIIMASDFDLWGIRLFNKRYNLSQFSNIHLGKDFQYQLKPFYGIYTVPFMALYNKDQRFIMGYKGEATANDILKAFETHP
jgi:thioredoxin-related protein